MNCQEVMELMQRHVDGDLDPQETARMWEHVSKCPDCAAMLNRLVQLSRGLEQLPRVVPPYSLVDAILPQLEGNEAAGMETIAEPYVRRPRARAAGRARREWIGRLSAVLSVAVVVGLMLVSGPSLLRLGPTASQQDAAFAPAENKKDTASPQAKTFTTDKIAASGTSLVTPRTPSGSALSDVTKGLEGSPSAHPSFGSSAKSGGTAKSGGSSESGGSAKSGRSGRGGGSAENGGSSAEPSAPPVRDHGVVTDTPPATNSTKMGIAPPASPSASPEPTVSIMESPADEESLSPDGQWKAVIREGKLQMVNAGDGTIVYESAADDGIRSGLVWTEDSSAVQYTFTDAQGNTSKKSFVISEMQEQTAP